VIKLPKKKYTPKQDVQLGKEAASEIRKHRHRHGTSRTTSTDGPHALDISAQTRSCASRLRVRDRNDDHRAG